MEKTPKDKVLDALEDLSSDDMHKFRNKLVDLRTETRVRRAAVERARHTVDLVDLLFNTFTEARAPTLTAEILTSIGCNQTALELRDSINTDSAGSLPQAQPQTQGDETTTQMCAVDTAPPRGGNDQPDTSSALIPSSLQFIEDIIRKERHNVYPVLDKSKRKRLALLINNVEFHSADMKRNGALRDEENMEKLLRALGYHVVKHSNLSGKQMDDALKSFAARPEHSESDSTFVVIMSHGKRDAILGVRFGPENLNDVLPVDNIYTHLNTANCQALIDKPKVILIQACRGNENGGAWVSDSEADNAWDMESDAWRHKEKDFISLLSCTPDTKSYRHRENGSLFIGFLVEIFNANAHKDHIEELFRQVMRRFEDFGTMKQMTRTRRSTRSGSACSCWRRSDAIKTAQDLQKEAAELEEMDAVVFTTTVISLTPVTGGARRSRAPPNAGGAARAAAPSNDFSEAAFIDKNWTQLVARATSVDPILDELLSKKVIILQQYNEIRAEAGPNRVMRALITGPIMSSESAKKVFYQVLMEQQPYMMQDLGAVPKK
ncbi:caspase a-like [Hoplias malabaricus]|uniref:caspase a-like n=1 Tax=Hoplias malabaricus TaxID=27720 RepID=UPI00346193F2